MHLPVGLPPGRRFNPPIAFEVYKHDDPKNHVFSPYMKALGGHLSKKLCLLLSLPFYKFYHVPEGVIT